MKLPKTAKVLTVANGILFPRAILPFHIIDPRATRLVKDALQTDRLVVVALQKSGWNKKERPESIAGLGLIRAAVKYEDNTYGIFVQGLTRVKLGKVKRYKPYRIAEISLLKTTIKDKHHISQLCIKALETAAQRIQTEGKRFLYMVERLKLDPQFQNTLYSFEILQTTLEELAETDEPEHIADLLSAALVADPQKQQKLLATTQLEERFAHLIEFLKNDSISPPDFPLYNRWLGDS